MPPRTCTERMSNGAEQVPKTIQGRKTFLGPLGVCGPAGGNQRARSGQAGVRTMENGPQNAGMPLGLDSGTRLEHCPSTSSSRRLCSFCCSIRFCLSASSCRLYSSCSRSCCSCRSCCLLRASERSLFSCWSRRKSRRSVDSPGTLTMELREEAGEGLSGPRASPCPHLHPLGSSRPETWQTNSRG